MGIEVSPPAATFFQARNRVVPLLADAIWVYPVGVSGDDEAVPYTWARRRSPAVAVNPRAMLASPVQEDVSRLATVG
jgi:hypothetical protein